MSFLELIGRLFKIKELIPEEPPTKPETKPEPSPEPKPPEAKPEPPQDGKYSTEGSQRLLIKPASDNTGNLVILLPAAWNNSFQNAWIEAGGKTYRDSGRRNINVNPDGSPAKNSNGNRRHLWYGVPGAAIGRGVLVVRLADGERRIERDFGQRTERVEK